MVKHIINIHFSPLAWIYQQTFNKKHWSCMPVTVLNQYEILYLSSLSILLMPGSNYVVAILRMSCKCWYIGIDCNENVYAKQWHFQASFLIPLNYKLSKKTIGHSQCLVFRIVKFCMPLIQAEYQVCSFHLKLKRGP